MAAVVTKATSVHVLTIVTGVSMSAMVTKVTSVPVLTIGTRFSVSAMVTKFTNIPAATTISSIPNTDMPRRTHQKLWQRRPFSNLFRKRRTQQIV
jgi:hypothetical protein